MNQKLLFIFFINAKINIIRYYINAFIYSYLKLIFNSTLLKQEQDYQMHQEDQMPKWPQLNYRYEIKPGNYEYVL